MKKNNKKHSFRRMFPLSENWDERRNRWKLNFSRKVTQQRLAHLVSVFPVQIALPIAHVNLVMVKKIIVQWFYVFIRFVCKKNDIFRHFPRFWSKCLDWIFGEVQAKWSKVQKSEKLAKHPISVHELINTLYAHFPYTAV